MRDLERLVKSASIVGLLVALSGCGESVEDMCKQTDALLKEKTGQGFQMTGYAGCLNQSPKEAAQTLQSLKDARPQVFSESDAEAKIASMGPEELLAELGTPDNYVFYLPQENGKARIGADGKAMYQWFPHAEGDPLQPIMDRFAQKADGMFIFSWQGRAKTSLGKAEPLSAQYIFAGGVLAGKKAAFK